MEQEDKHNESRARRREDDRGHDDGNFEA